MYVCYDVKLYASQIAKEILHHLLESWEHYCNNQTSLQAYPDLMGPIYLFLSSHNGMDFYNK